MSTITVSKKDRAIEGEISLTASKSISNRALIIRALCGIDFDIHNLASADDTATLQRLLKSDAAVLDAGPAGTTFRFLTAYLALRPGTQTLTGSERMKQRPIGVLVDALRTLGADIEYVEREGYPPLKINPPRNLGRVRDLTISASTSSQFVSALLMIAPVLPQGLRLHLDGNIVSAPYIRMTINLMRYFGVNADWQGNSVHIEPQSYTPRAFTVEADWSAASYLYEIAAFAEKASLQVNGLFQNSVQGDSAVAPLMEVFGLETAFNDKGLLITKNHNISSKASFEHDFLECPDVAQTLAVTCAGTGVPGLFSGLETLRIKETDRIDALKTELAKVGVIFGELPKRLHKKTQHKAYFLLEGKLRLPDGPPPCFATYHDHRMAMAFAPLGMFAPVRVEDHKVVSKSYPEFWDDLSSLGFDLKYH
jgi:3-phosphoshikimate 1-carboxyvinyltransferase